MDMHDIATAGRFVGRIHHLPVRVYYEDTDHSGVVYHANYLRYCERGRSDFLRMIGVHHAELLTRTPPLAFAVIGIDVRFIKPARIDDALVVHTAFDHVKGPRMMIAQTVERDGIVLATAAVEAVSIDLTGRPRRLAADVMTKLSPWLLPG
jgi:acyl-CoA thioester hydrolase